MNISEFITYWVGYMLRTVLVPKVYYKGQKSEITWWTTLAIFYVSCHVEFPIHTASWHNQQNIILNINIWITAKLHLPYHHAVYIPRNMHTVFALLCFVVVIHWLILPYPSGLLHWHCGNLTIAPVPAKQPWWIWINASCEFIMNDCITTTKQRTTKPCAYFLGYTVAWIS